MKLISIIALTGAGVIAYTLINTLSPDAVALAVGVLFGILAGIPITILALVSNRRTETPAALVDYWRVRALLAERQNLAGDVRVLPSSPRQIEFQN